MQAQESFHGPLLNKPTTNPFFLDNNQPFLVQKCESTQCVCWKYTALSWECLPKTHHGEDKDDQQCNQIVRRKLLRDSGNMKGVTLKRYIEKSWTCAMGKDIRVRRAECGLVLPEVTLQHHHPAQAGLSIIPWDTTGTWHPVSEGELGAMSGNPRVLYVPLHNVSCPSVWHKHMYIWSTLIYHGMGVQAGDLHP